MDTASPPRTAAAALARLMPRLARFASIRLEAGEPPLSLVQLYVLQRIAEGTTRGADLARRMQVSGPTISGILERLETAALLGRAADPDDRRAQSMKLTARGRDALAGGSARLAQSLDELLDGASPADVAALTRVCALAETALDARAARA